MADVRPSILEAALCSAMFIQRLVIDWNPADDPKYPQWAENHGVGYDGFIYEAARFSIPIIRIVEKAKKAEYEWPGVFDYEVIETYAFLIQQHFRKYGEFPKWRDAMFVLKYLSVAFFTENGSVQPYLKPEGKPPYQWIYKPATLKDSGYCRSFTNQQEEE